MHRNLTVSSHSLCANVAHWCVYMCVYGYIYTHTHLLYKICIIYTSRFKYIFSFNHKRYKCL